MMFYGNGGWEWWQALLMSAASLAFWVLLIWLVYALVTGGRHSDVAPGGADPRRILDERLARGEITPDEYRHVRDTLQGKGTPLAGTGVRT